MKPRLVVLASTYPRWKNDHEPSFVHELARRMTDRFDVVAIVPHAKGASVQEVLDGVKVVRYRYAPESLETLVNHGGIVTNLRRSLWKWLLVPTFILMQWVVARRYAIRHSVVHAHWIVPQGGVARLLGRPYVVTSHGADLFALRGRFAMVAKRASVGRARRMTVVSEAMRAPATALGSKDDVLVRSMGVDLKRLFTPSNGQSRDHASLLFVGRFVEKKGLDVLLHAMTAVVVAYPDARLTIVGHGPLEGAMRDLASALDLDNHVDFVGPVSQQELPAYYRAASLFVAPFREAASGDQEGLGLVLVEALGCGCPVIASDLPSTRDVLEGTQGAMTVMPGRVDALALALIDAIPNAGAMHEVAVRSQADLLARFDWDAVAAAYSDILETARTQAHV